MEIKETNNIIGNLLEYLDHSSTESSIIYKVNGWLRESNPDAYTPKMVSIGPYHKTNYRHGPMEEQKLLYLRRFLGRKVGLDLNNCISELHKLKEEVQKCYEDIKQHGTYDDFLSMLLLDGCFVVEFIRSVVEWFQKEKPGLSLIMVPKRTRSSFSETECNNIGNIKHLLHLLHIFSCNDINPREKIKTYCTCEVMPNATELSEAGVSFAKGSDITSLLDIKFESSGLMTIPCLTIERDTETLLRNLIAYEQQSSDVQLSKYFSHYVVFMDNLIDLEKDVNLLCQKGIIVNLMGDNKNVVCLFNTIGNGVTSYPDFYYNEEFKQAIEYSEKP